MTSNMAACNVDIRQHRVRVVVVLALLVIVHLTAQHYFSASLPLLLQSIVSNNQTLSVTGAAGAWSRDTSESATSVVRVDVVGNFTDRIARFNVELHSLRHRLRSTPPGNRNGKTRLGAGPVRVVWSVKDNYMDELSNNTDIVTVVLPWLGSRSNWTSDSDFSNVLYQRYFDWTADNVLCSWIETKGLIKARYDSVYRRTCNRNMNDTAQVQSLRPVHLNGKPINRNHYWPNNGNSYPEHYYTTTPPYVFFIHIHRDAVITGLGDVITASTKLVLYACSQDITPTLPFDEKLSQIPFYEEVYVITQHWGNAVFHRMAEIVPRLVLCLAFLKAHPEIRISGPQVGGRLGELLEIIGLDKSRLVTGQLTRAKIVYQPRATGCGFANVQESQLTSQLYRDYIRRTFPPQPRDRLVLIRRSRARRFTKQREIEAALERAATDYNLTYSVFIDNPTPSLNDTMMMFHSAVVIVAPHGAGLANMYFSQPGTYVVEGVCNLPHVNLCFQWLAHILGHHWHGMTSRGGCEGVVDVSAASVDAAVRSYLRLWMHRY